MSVYRLKRVQKVNASLDSVWDFIASPSNLKVITPPSMGFNITSGSASRKMYPGMIISYRVSPIKGLPMTWVTEITHIEEGSYFVDEQRIGPYRMWHHEHHLEEDAEGVVMTDIITYKPPLGFFGSIANRIFIKRQLEKIFEYRFRAVESYFGKQGSSLFTIARQIPV